MSVAIEREPSQWVEDAHWHRRMFGQSIFRWVAEDPLAVALTWTRGRIVYETPAHLRLLNSQLLDLQSAAAAIDDAAVDLLVDAQRRAPAGAWVQGLHLAGLTVKEFAVIRQGATGSTGRPLDGQARSILAEIPVPNPFSQTWELRQMRSLYAAAEALLEDTFCDLAFELSSTQEWSTLAHLTNHFTADALQRRVQAQRDLRGEPGDPRRTTEQHYPKL